MRFPIIPHIIIPAMLPTNNAIIPNIMNIIPKNRATLCPAVVPLAMYCLTPLESTPLGLTVIVNCLLHHPRKIHKECSKCKCDQKAHILQMCFDFNSFFLIHCFIHWYIYKQPIILTLHNVKHKEYIRTLCNVNMNMVALKRLSVLTSEAVIKALDKKRGDTPRSRFVARLLEQHLGISEKEKVRYIK